MTTLVQVALMIGGIASGFAVLFLCIAWGMGQIHKGWVETTGVGTIR